MREQLEERLKKLKNEFETGEKMISDLDNQRSELYQKVMRISGAIQVLEEELSKTEDMPDNVKDINKAVK